MSVNDAIKDMLYGHEHRWRVAEHELAQARAEVARLTAEVEAMRAVVDEAERVYTTCEPNAPMLMQHLGESLDALRARKVGG